MLCPNCGKQPANYTKSLGYLPCDECNGRQEKPKRQVEFTTEQIKSDRKQFASDLLQPFRDGEVSQEYIEKFGSKNLGLKPEDKPKKVWSGDLNYYKD